MSCLGNGRARAAIPEVRSFSSMNVEYVGVTIDKALNPRETAARARRLRSAYHLIRSAR